MDNRIGQIIKHYRLQANMTQADLADGLISVSYLSKIENGNQIPPRDIAELLSKRLDIPVELLNQSKDKDNKLIEDWIDYLLEEDVDNAVNMYENNIKQILEITHSTINIPIELHKFRYFLLLHDLDQALQQYQHLNMQSKKFSNMELYYWYKYSGIFWDLKEYHPRALQLFLKAEKHMDEFVLHEQKEQTDLYYRLATAASSSKDLHNVYHYNKKALDLFRSRYLLEECSESHLLFSNYFRQVHNYKQAWKCTEVAEDIASKINCPTLLAKCNESYGSIEIDQHHYQTGIDYLLKSYELCIHCNMEQKIGLILKLIKVYYIHNSHTEVSKWLEQVLLSVQEFYGNKINKQTLDVKMLEHRINHTNPNALESFVKKDIIPYFEERSLHYELQLYLRQLADAYSYHEQFQLAAIYYQKSLKTHNYLPI
ncbi:helix-turn-helix domain-containing protein [Oceanobacillus sp. 1P07AA]|uniref:helix-turn-helix domain-containing protein n=1 Tax=Oceanobacillus sp. 1P07AA TaxID=3132293 RepID=UPI0039A62B94